MLTNKEAVIRVVESGSGIGVAGLAARLRLDKRTVRKAALEAVREGRIGTQNNGQGYVFFPTSTKSQVIDGNFREVSAPSPASPASRALIPVGQQPYDSRTAAVLARNAAATQRGPKLHPPGFGGQIAEVLNSVFVNDPSGDDTLAALTSAWKENAAATRAAEARGARERAVAEHERQTALAAAEARPNRRGSSVWTPCGR